MIEYIEYAAAGLVALVLSVYLLVSLINPERWS